MVVVREGMVVSSAAIAKESKTSAPGGQRCSISCTPMVQM